VKAALSIALAGLLAISSACGSNEPSVPFKALDHYLGVKTANGYKPLIIKGVNLGVGIPGTEPGQLALDYDTYSEWFEQMGAMGVNTLRVYTLHYPRFYEALFAYNNLHPNRPLYLMQNIWLDEDNPTGGIDIFDFSSGVDQAIQEVVSAVHGNAEIPHRLGRAFGTYEVDVSRYVIGWILGRETYGGELLTANALHPEVTSFRGDALSIENSTPAQVWATERLDKLITYERDTFGVERPVAISNWPTTDPLDHPSEPHRYEGGELEIIWDAGEDDAIMQLTQVDTSRAPAGLFASYHVYPYYPNFLYRDPSYVEASDDEGPNNYIGYVSDLKDFYGTMPLLISEFGMPSSWGNAHDSPVAGFHHGGHDEATQADMTRRLGENIYEAGAAGGMVFSWMDEWWKRNWILHRRTFPTERLPLWFDVTNPEQNYGLQTYDLGSREFTTWPEEEGLGRVQKVRADYDAAYFHIEIDLTSRLVDGETLTIGFDTYDAALGEAVLPGGITQSTLRSEFALVIEAPGTAQLYITEAYDLYGMHKDLATDKQMGHSTATDGAPWKEWRWITNDRAITDDGSTIYELVDYNMGALRVNAPGSEPTTLDAIFLGDTIRIRMPWALLQFSDPSALKVIHDDLSTSDRTETIDSDGIAFSVALGAERLETQRFEWPRWDEAPLTVLREKPVLRAFEQMIGAWPDSPSRPPRAIPQRR
tara:strand:+ start:1528 stop:3642 length:2115 start_codon:yes stop_codon:yes gene_type:complete